MNNKIEAKHFETTDLKLQAFLRAVAPTEFIGVNKTNPQRIKFLFNKTNKITSFAEGYFQGKEFKFSPLAMATNIDQGKALVFGDY